MLSKEQVEKFQQIYKQHYGKEISYQDAYEQGVALINMLKIIATTLAKEKAKKPDCEKSESDVIL